MFRLILAVFLLISSLALAQDIHVFDYDRDAKLDVQEVGSTTQAGGSRVTDLSYASPKGGRVPAYLVTPPGKGPFAAVVFVHWGQGNRSEFLAEAVSLTQSGIASLMIDAPFNRVDRPKVADGPEGERDSFIQLVVDVRRAVDLLLARRDIDPKRLAYVGHSLGATWGGVLAACEKRFKALVLMAGLPEVSEYHPPDLLYQKQLSQMSQERVAANKKALGPIDPIHFVRQSAPAFLFFQWAQVDRFVSEEVARRYYAAAPGPKTYKFYYCSHELNDPQAAIDREQFLKAQLR